MGKIIQRGVATFFQFRVFRVITFIYSGTTMAYYFTLGLSSGGYYALFQDHENFIEPFYGDE